MIMKNYNNRLKLFKLLRPHCLEARLVSSYRQCAVNNNYRLVYVTNKLDRDVAIVLNRDWYGMVCQELQVGGYCQRCYVSFVSVAPRGITFETSGRCSDPSTSTSAPSVRCDTVLYTSRGLWL